MERGGYDRGGHMATTKEQRDALLKIRRRAGVVVDGQAALDEVLEMAIAAGAKSGQKKAAKPKKSAAGDEE